MNFKWSDISKNTIQSAKRYKIFEVNVRLCGSIVRIPHRLSAIIKEWYARYVSERSRHAKAVPATESLPPAVSASNDQFARDRNADASVIVMRRPEMVGTPSGRRGIPSNTKHISILCSATHTSVEYLLRTAHHVHLKRRYNSTNSTAPSHKQKHESQAVSHRYTGPVVVGIPTYMKDMPMW